MSERSSCRCCGPEQSSVADLGALRTNRRLFYRDQLYEAADRLRRYTDNPSEADVTELLTQRWFEPERDWQLFELAVLLRLEKAFNAVGTRKRIRPLGHSRSPFATFALADGSTLRIWYQTWPASSGPSEHRDAAEHYAVAAAGSRPDIVLELTRNGQTAGLVLELKATNSGEYLGRGFLQLLSYLRDRPALFGDREAVGWLVAPSEAPFQSRPADGRPLWAVGADEVAAAAVARILQISSDLA